MFEVELEMTFPWNFRKVSKMRAHYFGGRRYKNIRPLKMVKLAKVICFKGDSESKVCLAQIPTKVEKYCFHCASEVVQCYPVSSFLVHFVIRD